MNLYNYLANRTGLTDPKDINDLCNKVESHLKDLDLTQEVLAIEYSLHSNLDPIILRKIHDVIVDGSKFHRKMLDYVPGNLKADLLKEILKMTK